MFRPLCIASGASKTNKLTKREPNDGIRGGLDFLTNTEFSKKTGVDLAKNTLLHTRVQFLFLVGEPVKVFANV